jgi:hypothetical protein
VCDGSLLRDIVNAEFLVHAVDEKFNDGLRPIGTVAEQAKIRERLFRAAELALFLAEFVRELNQELAVAVSLVLGQGQDARDIVALGGLFLFREVANDVAAGGVTLTLIPYIRAKDMEESATTDHHVVKKGRDIVV